MTNLKNIKIAYQNHHWQTLRVPLQEWKKRSTPPPVLLLTGQAGIGKNSVASEIAQWIHCSRHGPTAMDLSENPMAPEKLLPCQECLSCQKTQSGSQVDTLEIHSEGNPESSSSGSLKSGVLKIDQFRSIQSTAGFGALEGQFKIILIPSADRMTSQAANSVLKLLEETPPHWIFILTATDTSLLLPTLVSRCQTLRLKPFSISEIEQILLQTELPLEKTKICALLSQGSTSRAFQFAQEEFWEKRKLFFEFLKEPSRAVLNLMEWAIADPSHFEVLIDSLEQLTADLLRWSVSSDRVDPADYSWENFDAKESLVSQIKWAIQKFKNLPAARSFWIEQAERLAQVRQEMTLPLNRKLLVQDILFTWLGRTTP